MSEQLSVLPLLSIGTEIPLTRSTSGMYYDSVGLLQTAAANVLRMSYDPGNLAAGPLPLVEPAALNLLPYSNQLDNAAWQASDVTLDAAKATGPDGQLSAFRLIEGGTNARHELRASVNLTGGTAYTLSAFGKAGARRLALGFSSEFGAEGYAVFDLVAGAVASTNLPAGATATLTQAANGFWRCSVMLTPTTTATGWVSIGLAAGAAPTYPGDGASDLYVTRTQLESGALTSPIDTGATATLRAADVLGDACGILYSNVPENDYPVYDPAATYKNGDFVIVPAVHRVFQSQADANTGKDPTDPKNQVSTAGSTIWWLDYSATNRYAMFDEEADTQTVVDSPLIVSLRPGGFNSSWLGALDADGLYITVQESPGGAVVDTFTSNLEASQPGDYDEYCFDPFRPVKEFLASNIDQYHNAVVTLFLVNSSGKVKCGMQAVGNVQALGRSQYGVKVKPKSYSYIVTDKFGRTKIERRKSAVDMDVTARLSLADAPYVGGILRDLLDKPVVWLAAGSQPYSDLRVFGLGSGDITYDHPDECLLTVNVKGLI